MQALREMPGKWSEWAERVWTVRLSAGFGVRYQGHVLGFPLLRAAMCPGVLRRWVREHRWSCRPAGPRP